MTADHIIAFADALRQTARASGRDLNAANLFVHTVLVRAIKYDETIMASPYPSEPAPGQPAPRPAPPSALL